MKQIKQLFFGCALFFASVVNSQVQINVNVGTAPNWGPSGYSDVQYYYLPDIEAYYDINSSMFLYMNNGVWIRRSYLPSRCKNYDLYGGYKVVLHDYHGNKPYGQFKKHKVKYYKGYKGKAQKNIGTTPVKQKTISKSIKKIESKEIKFKEIKFKENHGGNKKGGNNNGNHGGGKKGGNHGGGKGKN